MKLAIVAHAECANTAVYVFTDPWDAGNLIRARFLGTLSRITGRFLGQANDQTG